MFQSGCVEFFDRFLVQQKTVGNHPSDHAAAPDVPDDLVDLWMHQRLAAADGDDGSAHAGQDVQSAFHLFQRDGLGKIIKFVAIGAGQVAAPVGDNVHQDGVLGGNQGLANHAQFAQPRVREAEAPAHPHSSGRLR